MTCQFSWRLAEDLAVGVTAESAQGPCVCPCLFSCRNEVRFDLRGMHDRWHGPFAAECGARALPHCVCGWADVRRSPCFDGDNDIKIPIATAIVWSD